MAANLPSKKVRTHYDNLHVSRDASSEEIRAQYRKFSKMYHPDRNPDPDAPRIMAIINRAYEVLSDPQRRAEHDKWIAREEAKIIRKQVPVVYATIPTMNRMQRAESPLQWFKRMLFVKKDPGVIALVSAVVFVFFLLPLGMLIFGGQPNQKVVVKAPKDLLMSPPVQWWPDMEEKIFKAYNEGHEMGGAYAKDYPILYRGGKSHLTLQNDLKGPMFVYLFKYDAPVIKGMDPSALQSERNIRILENNGQAIRSFWIDRGASSIVEGLPSGIYYMRYNTAGTGNPWHQTRNIVLNPGMTVIKTSHLNRDPAYGL